MPVRNITQLLVAAMLQLTTVASYAAFPVKSGHYVNAMPSATVNDPATVAHFRHPSQLARLFHVTNIRKPNDQRPGWPGIAALVCGSIGFFPGALVFGIIGLNKRYKNHGLAIAGLILGVAGLVLSVLLIMLIVNALKISTSGLI